MKTYKVAHDFKARTESGVILFKKGQVIDAREDKADPLVKLGKLKPYHEATGPACPTYGDKPVPWGNCWEWDPREHPATHCPEPWCRKAQAWCPSSPPPMTDEEYRARIVSLNDFRKAKMQDERREERGQP